MKEELTTKMHSEFTVTRETDIKHRCWSALTMINGKKEADLINKYCSMYSVSIEELEAHRAEFEKLKRL